MVKIRKLNKNAKGYIKETIFNKTYLARKFCKCLTYEEQEQEILRGKSLERELAEINSDDDVKEMYENYHFNKICVFLTTTKKEISLRINKCEATIKDLSKTILSLGPATQQEAIGICEFIHDEYSKLKRTLKDVKKEYMDAKDEVEIEKNKLASLPLQESKRKRDEKYKELRISRSELRRQIQEEPSIQFSYRVIVLHL